MDDSNLRIFNFNSGNFVDTFINALNTIRSISYNFDHLEALSSKCLRKTYFRKLLYY